LALKKLFVHAVRYVRQRTEKCLWHGYLHGTELLRFPGEERRGRVVMNSTEKKLDGSRYSAVGLAPCPQCRGDLFRIRRRLIDRMLSLFVPVQRYSCQRFSCKWEGNLRATMRNSPFSDLRSGFPASGACGIGAYERETPVPKTFVVSMVFTIIGIVAVVLFTTTDWFSEPELASSKLSDDQWAATASRGGGIKLQVGWQKAQAAPAKQ
jgi:hypothetical protein